MATLSDDARGHLERYLSQVKLALRGHASVDASEVERDVRAHIDAELNGLPEPVDAERLRRVLDQLGTPHAWVPAEDLPAWRRVFSRIRSGPEDWRLAYLTFALFVLSPVIFVYADTLWPLPLLAFVPPILTARATLALLAEHDEPVGARRWLIYPPLVLLYAPVAVLLFVWPLPLAASLVEHELSRTELVNAAFGRPFWGITASLAVAALGTWWMLLGFVLIRFGGAVRATFWPFANWIERRHGMRLALTGLLLLAIAGAVLLALRLRG